MASTARDRRGAASVSDDTTSSVEPAPSKAGWLSGMTAMFRADSAPHAASESNANELLAFPSEATLRQEQGSGEDAPKSMPAPAPAGSSPRKIALAVVIVAGVAAGFAMVALRRIPLPSFATPAPRTGNLTIDTQPAAAEVLVDGERRGTTPLTVALAAGAHTITIESDGDTRVVPLTIAAGADVTQHFELRTRETVAQFGRMSIATEPPGARVSIDGHLRGVSPLVVADLTAEEHTVTVSNDTGASERKVLVSPGSTASVMFSLASKASGPVGGWLSVSAPFDVEVTENNDIIGASRSSRIMLAAGRHDLVLTNRSLGYQEARKIDVVAGKTTTLRVEPPQVTISVNARPWAEVVMDGANIGQTPLANLLVTVGSHELIFRNPQLGERKQTVLVTATGPNRIATDLTK